MQDGSKMSELFVDTPKNTLLRETLEEFYEKMNL